MSVIAMQIVSMEHHPNADALRIYQMEAPGHQALQVVANLENVYQVGDIVAVAQVGAKLQDGTKIRRSKLRGIESLGMAMGTVQHPVGTDLTAEYCIIEPAPEEATATAPPIEVVRWTSIEQLHHVVSHFEGRREYLGSEFVYPCIEYKAKIKLDGTNGGVHILPTRQVIAQSRTRLLDLEDDNIGFAAWVTQHQSYFQALSSGDTHTILFGEWCGKGIQKRTAISKIPQRIFAVFAVQWGDHNAQSVQLEIEPSRIRAMLPEHPDIFVLPWQGESVVLDFGQREQLKTTVEQINAHILQVEETDPWVKQQFGIEGLGEGLVMYPLLEGYDKGPVDRDRCTELMFKAKGEKHQAVKQAKPVQIDPQVAENIGAFAEMFLTPSRLEQGVQEGCGGVLAMEKIADFLKWIGQDIKKEGTVELEASGLEWKDVSKTIATRARDWYRDQVQSIG